MPNVCRILRSSWGGNSSQSWPPAGENCCSPTIRLVAPVCEQPLKTHLQIPCCTGENFNVGTWKYFYVSIFCVLRKRNQRWHENSIRKLKEIYPEEGT